MFHAAMDGFARRHEADQKFVLLVARSQAIWSRCDPKHIPSVESIQQGRRNRPRQSDLAANARAWIAVLKAQQKPAA